MAVPSLLETFGAAAPVPSRRTSLVEVFLMEDSREKIVSLLKLSRGHAEYFNDQSPEHAFVLAHTFRLWDKGSHHTPGSQLRDIINPFMNELGDAILALLRRKPALEGQLKSVRDLAGVKGILAGNRKWEPSSPGSVIMALAGGWMWLRLSDEEHEEEGKLMGHCATDERGDLVSLRDPHGRPHVTMTWDAANRHIHQIKGKQNALPNRKYWPAIEEFFRKFKAILMDDEIDVTEDELGKRLFSPSYESMLDVLEPLAAGPARDFLWAEEGFLNRDYRGNVNKRARVVLREIMVGLGFEEDRNVWSSHGKQTLYYAGDRWRRGGSDPVPYDQATEYFGFWTSQMRDEGLTNDRVGSDPRKFMRSNFGRLKKFCDSVMRNISGRVTTPYSWPFATAGDAPGMYRRVQGNVLSYLIGSNGLGDVWDAARGEIPHRGDDAAVRRGMELFLRRHGVDVPREANG